MASRRAIGAYFGILPGRFRDGPRLYAAYAASVVLNRVAPSRFGSVGLWIPGQQNLCVSLDGIRFYVRPHTNDLDLISRTHEPVTTRWFRVEPRDTVVDVGAHIGRYTLMAATKASKVIAVEPDPSSFQLLKANVALNGFSNVVVVPEALSSTRGTRLLRLASRDNTGTSSISPDGVAEPTVGEISAEVRVRSDTLDHLVETFHVRRIDWLKIDVEGHEIEVLRGGPAALKVTRKLILEVTESTDETCRRIVELAGFELDGIERGDPASNWLLLKKDGLGPAAGI